MRAVRSLLVPLLAAPLAAQGDYALVKTSPGTLGRPLAFAYSGAPAGKRLLFMLSTSAGPTRLDRLDPRDTRVLRVGLEAAASWFTVPSAGAGKLAVPVPADPFLHGFSVHFQTATLPGSPFLLDRVSNDVVVQLGAAGDSVMLPARLNTARSFAHALVDPFLSSSRFDVVLAGGGRGNITSAKGLDSSEVYDFHTMTVRKGPKLTRSRALGVAVRLLDGRVLLAGGVDNLGNPVRSAEVYDPGTHRFTATGVMNVARIGASGVLLPTGDVLVAGGTTTFLPVARMLATTQRSCEVWSPKTGRWTLTGSMKARRLAAGLVDLRNGRVMVTGGFEVRMVLGLPIPVGSVRSCEIYDFATRAWKPAAPMNRARALHVTNNVVLRDGRLLVTGGFRSGLLIVNGRPLRDCEVYDPRKDTWTPVAPLPVFSALHSATLMPSGKVVVAGGMNGTVTTPIAIDNVQEYDPKTNAWRVLPKLETTRGAHAAVVTPDGTLVLLGGQGGKMNDSLSSIETLRF